MAVTANALLRVLRVRPGGDDSQGAAAFTIEVDRRQYLVTAHHVAPDSGRDQPIELFFGDEWSAEPIEGAAHIPGEIDIAVFSLRRQISPTLPLDPTSDGFTVGQEAFFLGFPAGQSTLRDDTGRPLPLAKRAALMGWRRDERGGLQHVLDALGNPGFSGGPVVFRPSPSTGFRVAGIVSYFRFLTVPVRDDEGRPTGVIAEVNSGILTANDISHAVAAARDLGNGHPVVQGT